MKRLTTVICMAGALTAATVLAQESQPGQKQPGAQPQLGQQSPTYSPTGREGMHGKQVRASKVIGAEVKTQTGEELGKIEDVVLDPQDGRAEFAVINWENKLVPVPFKVLKTTPAATTPGQPGMERITFTAQIEKDKLQSAPTISDKTRWSELQQPTFSQRVYAHYGVEREGVGAPGLGIEREPGQPGSRPGQPPSSRPGQPGAPGTSPRQTPN